MIRFFIGYDQVEAEAYHVLCHSILKRSSVPVSFTPIYLPNLTASYSRQRDPKQSNEFSFSRFLVPYLCGYEGWGVFLDLDMMFRVDAAELLEYMNPLHAVVCCQHDYVPKTETKYLGAIQYKYPRKNWSSVMLFNCGHSSTRQLTTSYIHEAPALDLHRMFWADENIGSLPLVWNWLEGEYDFNADAKNVHWTIGGPWNEAYKNADYADEWFAERDDARTALSNSDVTAA